MVSTGKSVWDGTTYVWGKVSSVGDALGKLAAATWDGAEVLGGWMKTGLSVASHYAVDYAKRNFYVVCDSLYVFAEVAHDIGLDAYNGFKYLGTGIVEVGKGNFEDGFTLLYAGAARLTVEITVNAWMTTSIRVFSNLQMLLYLEPMPRRLTDEEKNDARLILGGDRWWLGLVEVKDGFCGLWSAHPAPFVNQMTIFMKSKRDELRPDQYLSVLLHELVHVWQFMYGGGNFRLNSLLNRATEGEDQYNWEKVAPGTPWKELLAEQQAELIQDGFDAGYFHTPGTAFHGPLTGTNFTAYLDAAVRSYRANEGTPRFDID